MNSINTEEKILSAAIELMGEKGYKSITIKDIAMESGFSEMTVFRHFETKVGVLEAAIKKYSRVLPIKKLFSDEILWQIEEDLFRVAVEYQKVMQKNKTILLLALEERHSMPHLLEQIAERPFELKKYLMDYFQQMQIRGKICDTDTEAVAVAFIHMNFGLFFSTLVHGNYMVSLSDEEFIRQTVQIFIRATKL